MTTTGMRFGSASSLVAFTAVLLLCGAACGKTNPPDAAPDTAPADGAPTTSAAVVRSADASVQDASIDAAAAAPSAESADPYGPARAIGKTLCGGVGGKRVADVDMRTSFVDGNDLLAIVNRTPQGQLAPDFAPSDLVDWRTGKPTAPADCDKVQCLRKDASAALGELMAEMKKRGFPGRVESAFRGYGNQCGTFLRWASKGGFCDATEQSALPGHSQHQLGTTVDMFSEEWGKDERGVFREGFGCTDAGKFLQEHAWDYGFVMPYPIHPDDRHPKQKCVVRWDIPIFINPKSGYRFEHWHIRYVGKDAAQRFKKALEASGPGTPDEITVEQWLRSEKGLGGPDAELPVCDGCNCGACATLAAPGESPCDKKGGAIHLDAHGRPVAAEGPPQIASAKRGSVRKWKGRLLEVKVDAPAGVLTQPPIVGPDVVGYGAGSTFQKLSPYPDTAPRAYRPLAHAWVVGVEPVPNDTGVAWPWRAAITASVHGQIYDRADVTLPVRPGHTTLKIPLPAGATRVRVVLLEGGTPKGEPQTIELR
jgi:D-alanyl-D-alanine carboxypeptidase